ncbi:Mitogen-activated protein kinase kinase kinase kinase 5 isoform 1 [Schistosoma japonicum]|uniref:Mitogen-activated protein kinase kinase kinase kinase n=1 Tax=Schistosoma japonicum TaxID=6182 RepID=A0A4Z2CWM1_SCHJA|nr:Mitogen-activated protein kinase kinase kinase kinase 5 isoform 1 [Schistosoma japonicum]
MSHPKLDYLRQFVKPNDPKEEYKILSPIGSGTYGDVFKAVHRERRTLVAVKVMKIDLKDDIRSICQEIHTLRECRHPNIVQFYGSYLRNNKLWICMEYCGGQSMQDIYLYTRRPLEEDCIAFVSRETLQGLNFMHNRGRIHRDIKGANILLTDDGHVKVADFGVAAQLSTSIAKRTTLIGTPYWMAPEVASIECRGSGYDGKCDIWGVGITAIEYAELQPPMFDLDPRKALQILGSRNYKPPSLQDRHKWSPLFHSFVKCCLIKAERRRPDAATMLTHNFITNPHLSTLLTQRLLCYRRQLESSAKNAYSHGDAGISLSNKRNPLPGVSNMVMSNSGQQDEFNKSPSVNNDLSVSCGVGASGALHFVSSQQFVFERKPELFPNVQIQNSLSCSDLADDLLREVMDAFDQRRSGVDFHASQSVDDLDINQTDDIKLNIQSQNDLSITRPTPPAPRSRSKRRAPPPPPLQSSAAFNITTATVTTNESNTMYSSFDQIINLSSLDIGSDVSKTNNLLINGLSAPSHENHVEETSNDITLNYNIKIIREDFVNNNNNEDEKYSNSVSINHNGQSPSNDNDKTLTPAPPRPPPPKFDNSHTVASLPTPLRKNKQNDDLKHISRQHQLEMGIGLPPTPKVHMGACFMQIFEGCPLKVNSTATWVNPETLSQIILFGTNDGIYYLDLVNLADGTLELLVPRRCLWLFVFKDTMMSISGRHPQLFSHNLISLMKSRTSQTRFLHKRFQPTVKVPDTRGCCIASVVRNQFKGMKYLCGTIAKSIFVMEWYNPRNTFIEVKRVEVPCMPNPVLNFDLIINPNQNLPTVCLGVSSTSDPLVYKLHLVNLNEDSSSSWYTNPCRLEDQLQVIKVVQLDTRSLLICFPTHATMVNMNGRVLVSRDGRIAKFPFDTTVDSIVRLPDSVLAFHTHGLRGIDFFGRITQDIDDDKHVYRLLGSDRYVNPC